MSTIIPDTLYSIQLERQLLGGFINHPQSLIDLSTFISEKDFHVAVNQIIFSVLKNMVLSGNKVEKILLAQKVVDLGISKVNNEISVFEYVEDLSYSQLQPHGIKEISKELIKLRIRRELFSNGALVQQYVKECGSKSIDEIISQVDNINNKLITQYSNEDKPEDLFYDLENIVNYRAAHPEQINGIWSPFPIFNGLYGKLKNGTITAICGRAKNNKSTILLNIGWGSLANNTDLKVLLLDTEMKRDEHQLRLMSAYSQVNLSYIEDGSWAKNKELADKVKSTFPEINKLKHRFYHYHIGNRPIEEVVTMTRRWAMTECGRGGMGLIILDYIKIGDEKLSNYHGEHQEIGRKINKITDLANELNMPFLTSMQLNRSAIIDQREDEAAISMSDRLSWFAGGVFIFRKKRPDEIDVETTAFGTHKLIPVVLRYQGKDSSLLDLVRVTDNQGNIKYRQNFINYNFSNFKLEERGTFRDIIRQRNLQVALQSNRLNQDSNSI